MSRRSSQNPRPARRASARRLSLEPLEARELLTGFLVTSAGDNGNDASPVPNSLRAAIAMVNADTSVGADTISFAIPGGGVQTINLLSALPTISRTVVIDAGSQPGFTPGGAPQVVIDGTNAGAGANGLTITSGNLSVIRDLSIVGFKANVAQGGAGIYLQGAVGGVLIEGNYLGVLPDGSTARANANGIVVTSTSNTIGGTTATARNLISGNVNAGVLLTGGTATNNQVEGNYLGTNASGNAAVGNQYGVILSASNNIVGGSVAGAGNLISGNVGPTGQTGVGVLFKGRSDANLVAGNRIGTNAAGTAGLFPASTTFSNVYGIYFGGTAADSITRATIGGTSSGSGNLISGNFVGITGIAFATTSLIAGNTIGLDSAGNAPIPNGAGIFLGVNGSTIGGSTAAAGNVISGNGMTGTTGTGVDLTGDSDVVQGNYIGLTSSGLGGLGVGNVIGLALNVTNSTIGGSTLGASNVISGNAGDALTLQGNGSVGVFGNLIGRTPGGAALPNGGNGIVISILPPSSTPNAPLALNDSIGGTASGAGNTIVGNGGAGIIVHNSYPTGVTGLGIRGNTIDGNARLGIDLPGNGVPLPSTLFLNGSSVANGRVTISGVFFGSPSKSYAIDLFANPGDPSGYGQGPIYLGSVTVSTNGSGFAVFSPSFVAPSTPYTSFTATETGPDGNTSEFSINAPLASNAPGAEVRVTTKASTTSVMVGNSVTLTETVTNFGPNTAIGVTLFDSLPTSLVNARVSTSQGTAFLDSNNVLSARLGSLAVGQSITVTITGVASVQGALLDQPGASGTTFDPNYSDNFARQSITVTPGSAGPNADLAITETASPSPVGVGGTLTYVVTVTNRGPNTSTNATVNDFLPSGVTVKSATPSQGSVTSNTGVLLSANLGSILPGASATLTIVVTPSTIGTITNAANVSGNQFDPISGNNATSLTSTVQTASPRINLVLAQSVGSSTGFVGQNQFFVMTVTNAGPDAATNVTLIDTLPSNVTFVNVLPTQGGFGTLSNGVLTQNFGTIAAGGSATLTLIVAPKVPGLLVNYAGAYSPDMPSAPASFAYGAISIPSGPSVIGVAGFGKNSQLVISFDEDLNPVTATNASNFQLVALGKTGKGPNTSVRIASATYNSIAHSVMLTPAAALDPTQFYQLVVIGSTPGGVADTRGRRLASPQYGTPGGNFLTTFFAGTLPQI